MSKKSEYGYNPTFPKPTELTHADIEAQGHNPNNLKNERYQQLMADYFKCTTLFLNETSIPLLMEQQLKRRDLDTVCAYELYQMKKAFLTTNLLDLSNFVQQ